MTKTDVDMPLVSVIMSVYNTNIIFLKEAVRSIENQTYTNLEFVVVDDGSTDKEVNRYLSDIEKKDKRVRVIKNDNNIGLTRSLNRAIDYSQGIYLARMDSDDVSLPERIAKQVEYMEAHPDVCMTGTNTFFLTGDDCKRPRNRGHMSDQRVREIHLLYENEGYAHSTFMLRKSFLDEHGIRYRVDLPKSQDYGLTTDCIMAGGKRFLIEEPLVKYRIHDSQISQISFAEQEECEARTGFRRLRATFESLSDEECWAVARLNQNSQEYTADLIINAIKKMIAENREKRLFDPCLFKRVFRYEWYRKFMRISRINKRPWGMFRLFSIRSIPTVVFVKIADLGFIK